MDRKERYTEDGLEIMDPKPMQPPLGYKRAPTLTEQIRQQVLAHKLEMLDQLEETEEEADDFEVGDDFEPSSKYENDNTPSIKELKGRVAEINAEIQRQNTEQLRQKIEKEIVDKGGVVRKKQPVVAEGDDDPIPLK